jgi:hypothetical protein
MRPANAAIDDMENLNFSIRNDLSTIDPWHTCRSQNANENLIA